VPSQLPTGAVLDIGIRDGSIIEQWTRLGCGRLVGERFCRSRGRTAPRAISRHPDSDADIAKPGTPFAEEFDVVSAVDVLYHLMDETSYRQALHNVYRALRPGGVFIFSDLYSDAGAVASAHHTVHRPWPYAERCLTEAGFLVERRRPQYVLMENPGVRGAHCSGSAGGWCRGLQVAAN
jgi:SAM-dependent methyltransferase